MEKKKSSEKRTSFSDSAKWKEIHNHRWVALKFTTSYVMPLSSYISNQPTQSCLTGNIWQLCFSLGGTVNNAFILYRKHLLLLVLYGLKGFPELDTWPFIKRHNLLHGSDNCETCSRYYTEAKLFFYPGVCDLALVCQNKPHTFLAEQIKFQYLCQWDFRICPFICPLFCQSDYTKTFEQNFHETCMGDGSRPRTDPVNCWCRST